MGKYINVIDGMPLGSSFESKCRALIENGAEQVSGSDYLQNMICVVDNGLFAAAGWAYNEDEWKAFNYPCGRRKQWFVMDGVENYAN